MLLWGKNSERATVDINPDDKKNKEKSLPPDKHRTVITHWEILDPTEGQAVISSETWGG